MFIKCVIQHQTFGRTCMESSQPKRFDYTINTQFGGGKKHCCFLCNTLKCNNHFHLKLCKSYDLNSLKGILIYFTWVTEYSLKSQCSNDLISWCNRNSRINDVFLTRCPWTIRVVVSKVSRTIQTPSKGLFVPFDFGFEFREGFNTS